MPTYFLDAMQSHGDQPGSLPHSNADIDKLGLANRIIYGTTQSLSQVQSPQPPKPARRKWGTAAIEPEMKKIETDSATANYVYMGYIVSGSDTSTNQDALTFLQIQIAGVSIGKAKQIRRNIQESIRQIILDGKSVNYPQIQRIVNDYSSKDSYIACVLIPNAGNGRDVINYQNKTAIGGKGFFRTVLINQEGNEYELTLGQRIRLFQEGEKIIISPASYQGKIAPILKSAASESNKRQEVPGLNDGCISCMIMPGEAQKKELSKLVREQGVQCGQININTLPGPVSGISSINRLRIYYQWAKQNQDFTGLADCLAALYKMFTQQSIDEAPSANFSLPSDFLRPLYMKLAEEEQENSTRKTDQLPDRYLLPTASASDLDCVKTVFLRVCDNIWYTLLDPLIQQQSNAANESHSNNNVISSNDGGVSYNASGSKWPLPKRNVPLLVEKKNDASRACCELLKRLDGNASSGLFLFSCLLLTIAVISLMIAISIVATHGAALPVILPFSASITKLVLEIATFTTFAAFSGLSAVGFFESKSHGPTRAVENVLAKTQNLSDEKITTRELSPALG